LGGWLTADGSGDDLLDIGYVDAETSDLLPIDTDGEIQMHPPWSF